MDIKKVYDILSECARDWASDADWFDHMHAPSLSELYRFGQKTVLDFIDIVHDECKTVDEIDEILDNARYDYFNRYKQLQDEHFEHLAELALSGYMALGDIVFLIERNK